MVDALSSSAIRVMHIPGEHLIIYLLYLIKRLVNCTLDSEFDEGSIFTYTIYMLMLTTSPFVE